MTSTGVYIGQGKVHSALPEAVAIVFFLAGFVTQRVGGFEFIPVLGILLFFALLSHDH